jgi:uncharacterized protein (TIGR03437 family)
MAACATAQTIDFNTGQAARLIIGQKNFTISDYGATNQLIGSPAGLALANGTLWVVDSNRLGSTPNNNRILRFSDTSTYPRTTDQPDIPGSTCGACRGTASLVLGQPDFFTTSRNLSATGVRNPTGVATDGNILVVSDTDNNRVLIWNSLPRANGQPANVVIGQPDFVHNATAVPPTATSLRGPQGVWLQNGKLFIADSQDNRILIYNKIPTTNNAPADVVIGQKDFTTFINPDLTQTQPLTTASNLQTPIAVSSDGTRMFVADLGQNRILIWNTIPTSNGAPADVVLGQPDMTSFAENNSANRTDHTPILCASNGTNTTVTPNVPTFPQRCAATMSFPRFVISDGKRLYVADGGNDRVLIYKTIPTTNGARADIILGQPDEFSDDTGFNPDGTNAVQTPTSLAWDGSNLYVSDGFNRRVVIFSPAVQSVPLDGIRNAGSLEIYAIGSVTLSGTPTAKDTITITIAGTEYTYTVKDKDTLENAIQGLVLAIDKAPDPNVIATANLSASAVVVTAKKPGATGGEITLAVKNSTNATIIGTVGGATLNIYLENPSQIAPGTLIRILGTNLCDSTVSADFTKTYLPTSLAGCSVYIDGVAAPLLYVSPSQINAQVMYEAQDRTSISTWVRKVARDGSVIASTPIATTIVPQNPGLFAQEGNDPRPGIIFHGSSSAFDLIGVDGSAQEGDVANIVVAGTTYTYTVKKGDTLAIIRDALISLINSKPDPLVHASIANEYTRIALNANVPGPAGEGITVTVSVSTDAAKNTAGAALLLTAYNPTLCCSNVQGAPVNSGNPAVPGEMLYTFATGLGVPEPNNIDTGRIFTGGNANPPKVFVDSILTAGTTANVVSVGLLPGTAGVYYVQFQLNSGLASNTAAQMTIAQQAFVSNVVTFPVAVPGLVSQLVIAPEFYAVDAGVPLTYRVTALDYKGNLATAYTGPLHITTTDTAATVPGDFSLSSGTATFQMKFVGKGLQSVTVTDPTITTINVTAPSVTVR